MTAGHPEWCTADAGCSAYADDMDVQRYHRSAPLLIHRAGGECTIRISLSLDPQDFVAGRCVQPPALEFEDLIDRETQTTGEWWRTGETRHFPMLLALDDAAGVASALIVLLAAADPRYLPRRPR